MSVEQKLLHFVSIDTQSDESSQTIPSTMKQKDLAKVLEKICIEIGFDEVFVCVKICDGIFMVILVLDI